MKIVTKITYIAEEKTVGELLDALQQNKGNPSCMYPFTDFITKRAFADETPSSIKQSWPWFETQRPNLKVYILQEEMIKNTLE